MKSIGIYTHEVTGSEPWDPDRVKSGICGSEESVIYMSEQLAKLNYKVVVFGNPPVNSPHSVPEANPRYLKETIHDENGFDIAIAWRWPEIGELLRKRANKVFLWPHDTLVDQLTDKQIHDFDNVLWLSHWQRSQWISVNPHFSQFTFVAGNGINPEQFQPVQARINPHSCIYGSNYARGLDILLDIWVGIKKLFPGATLDIYYGWQHWKQMSNYKEMKMRKQIADFGFLNVREHGQVSHKELNKAYAQASIWAYPCTKPEVFCISALRAQLSGALPVIIEGSALKETVRHGFKCHKKEEYVSTLFTALHYAEKMSLEERKTFGKFVLQEFTWEKLAHKWMQLFDS